MEPYRATASANISLLIADSNQTERQLLLSALRRHPEFQIAACSLETNAIENAACATSPQVAVLNVQSPKNGAADLATIRRLHLMHPETSLVLLLDSYEKDLVINAFRAGVKGLFCLAEHPFRMLCKCIHRVYEGQVWANTEQMQYLLEAVSQTPSLHTVNVSGEKLLTPREEQVVTLVADGLSNREIARELNLSENTIKKYIFRIFEKLGVSSRVELVLYAVNHGGHREAEWLAAGA